MAITYTTIANSVVSTNGITTISLTGIPNTYTDLRIVWSAAVAQASSALFRVNNDTSANYGQQTFSAYNTNRLTYRANGATQWDCTVRVAMGTSIEQAAFGWIDIFSYAQTNNRKTAFSYSHVNNALLERSVFIFAKTDVINSIQLSASGQPFQIGSRVTLYGIARA